MKCTVKNWAKFQHYRDRNPPWIKLHKSLLDDQHWHALPDASKALAVSIWLIASESKDGSFDADSATLAFRLRTDSKKIESALKPLIDQGFVVVDSNVLAECGQLAVSEERRGETETEERVGLAPVKFSAKLFLSERGVDPLLAADVIAHRKKKGAADTLTAYKAIEREAQKANVSLSEALTEMVSRNWQSFKADWFVGKQQSGQSPSSWVQTI